jgi:hypothetical protein
MPDDTALPILTRPARLPSPLEQLADIPEEEIWLQKQKGARTRRAHRLDVMHFMRTLGIASAVELRQADHKGGDRLGALYARDRPRSGLDDPPANRGIVIALQAPGPPRSRRPQPGRRGRATGDQSR